MRFGLFRRGARPAKPEAEATARVKALVLRVGGFPPDTVLAVNEIICTDPSCPGTETVVLVMQPGRKTRAYKMAKALHEVTEEDVQEALVASPPLPSS